MGFRDFINPVHKTFRKLAFWFVVGFLLEVFGVLLSVTKTTLKTPLFEIVYVFSAILIFAGIAMILYGFYQYSRYAA